MKPKTFPNIQKECDKILKLMKENQNYLCKKNKPLLAYLMLRWQNLYYAGRILYGDEKFGYQCQNNPKYEFESMENSEANGNIIYDAWAVSIDMQVMAPAEFREKSDWIGVRDHYQMNEKDFDQLATFFNKDNDFTKLLHKKNKTMQEWYALLSDPNHRYSSMYPTKKSVDDHLLCVIGNGYDWNKDGFICDDGPSGEDGSDYGKYMMMKGKAVDKEGKKIGTRLNKILMQPHVQEAQEKAKKYSVNQHFKHFRKSTINFSSASIIVVDLIFNENKEKDNKILSRVHPILVELMKKTYKKYKGKNAIAKVAKEMQELEKQRKRILEGKSKEEKDKWLKENETKEEKEFFKKIAKAIADVEELFEKEAMKLSKKAIMEIAKLNEERIAEFVKKEIKGERTDGSYYPISQDYSKISTMPKNVHPSYIQAGIEICLDIVTNAKVTDKMKPHDKERVLDNVLFAKEFLSNHGYEEYKKDLPKKIDKYAILKELEILFKPVQKIYPNSEEKNYHEQKKNTSIVYLNDSNKSRGSDNNYYLRIVMEGNTMPQGLSNDISFIEGLPLHLILNKFLDNVKKLEDVKAIFFYFENITDKAIVEIEIMVQGKEYHFIDILKSETELANLGFGLSKNCMSLELDNCFLVTSKAITLGSKHDMNTDGKQYFSNAQFFDVYDKLWNKLDSYNIDERRFNSFSGGKETKLTTWLHEQHTAMKKSDIEYGYGKREGTKCLYAHDFMLWLKVHQLQEKSVTH